MTQSSLTVSFAAHLPSHVPPAPVPSHPVLGKLRSFSWRLAKDLLRDHHLQALPSRQGVLQDLGGQGHQLCQGDRCLLEHLWDHLFQKDQEDQGVQGCPRRSKIKK